MNIKAKPNSMTDQAALDAIVDTLYAQIKDLSATAAVDLIDEQAGHVIGKLLTRISSTYGFKILNRFPEDRAEAIAKSHPSPGSERWLHTRQYLEDSIGRLMEKPCCIIKSGTSVRDTIEEVRRLVNGGNPMTYVYVTDEKEVLQGIVVLRDLMLASPDQTIDEVSIDKPFYLKPETSISDAMQATVRRHFPVYPVCDDKLRLVGTVKGNLLFEEHAFNLSAQSGRMVGVVKEERLHTPWFTSLKYRHPWLQFNLLTAFLAAAVISMFEDTITQLVLLVAFLPVLAGQSGNTGCQSL
ncbi:MAG: magnesium transporter, partial [Gammaproteobacteria bacterium]|nr:magnesium transporter [Gammaproteobacteria bacterium]